MRFILTLLVLSPLLVAQDMGQQAAQTAIQQTTMANQQAAQQAVKDMNDAGQRANQQAIDATTAANRNAQQTNNVQTHVTRTPKFSPKPGTYTVVSPRVMITDASKGAVIYFTTDGSTPTANSQRYTGPIAISATTTVKAMAIAPSSEQSPTAKGSYVVK